MRTAVVRVFMYRNVSPMQLRRPKRKQKSKKRKTAWHCCRCQHIRVYTIAVLPQHVDRKICITEMFRVHWSAAERSTAICNLSSVNYKILRVILSSYQFVIAILIYHHNRTRTAVA